MHEFFETVVVGRVRAMSYGDLVGSPLGMEVSGQGSGLPRGARVPLGRSPPPLAGWAVSKQ